MVKIIFGMFLMALSVGLWYGATMTYGFGGVLLGFSSLCACVGGFIILLSGLREYFTEGIIEELRKISTNTAANK